MAGRDSGSRASAISCHPMILTFSYRIKGSPAKRLDAMARAVNFVWNFCGNTQNAARRHNKRWPSGFDLINLTSGCSRELGLHSDTVQAVCKEFAVRRSKIRRRPRWRGKRALGWVPFQSARAMRLDGGTAVFLGRRYRLWYSRPVRGEIRSGCFAADNRGRWYINLQCEVEEGDAAAGGEVGIDLGLTTLATLSTGDKIANPRIGRKYAAALARAQRAGRKKRARAIHTKIERTRKHYLHERSAQLVQENGLIAVGNVKPSQLARTRMAKSVLDAGWTTLRHQLRYKAMARGARYIEVDERWTTQTCSACGARGGPRGLAGLAVREWGCTGCGAWHDRDVNSALLILFSGRSIALQSGNPGPSGRGRC